MSSGYLRQEACDPSQGAAPEEMLTKPSIKAAFMFIGCQLLVSYEELCFAVAIAEWAVSWFTSQVQRLQAVLCTCIGGGVLCRLVS